MRVKRWAERKIGSSKDDSKAEVPTTLATLDIPNRAPSMPLANRHIDDHILDTYISLHCSYI